MKAEELLALPEDRIDRELIRGKLIERPRRFHSPAHGGTAANLAVILEGWSQGQPVPRGEARAGSVGFILRRDPDTLVGIDLAIASAELAARTDGNSVLDGPPVLAVEILEPWDTHGEVVERIREYLEAGATAWVVDPDFRLVDVHRPGRPPETFNILQEFTADPYLPGLRVRVADLFRA